MESGKKTNHGSYSPLPNRRFYLLMCYCAGRCLDFGLLFHLITIQRLSFATIQRLSFVKTRRTRDRAKWRRGFNRGNSWMERLEEAIMATKDENVADRKKLQYY